jgi:peptidoglycan/xylan/chitin deacetylase (PgdA/CDA1 family)
LTPGFTVIDDFEGLQRLRGEWDESPSRGSMLTRMFRPFVRSGAILCYHGIATGQIRSPVHHTVAELEAAVGVARDLGRIVPLSDFVRIHQSGKSTAGLFAITFDDAYLSLQASAAFLRREQVPITVFAVSDALDDGRAFWWDRVGAVLARLTPRQTTALSDRWAIPIWFRKQWSGSDFAPGWELRQWVVARYAGRWPAELEERLGELEQPEDQATTDRSMTWSELSDFARTCAVEIGVHTRSHAALPLLTIAEQRQEIAGCYEVLRDRFHATSPILAAPFGLFNADTIAATRASGLQACLGLGDRTLRYGGDIGALPRFCMMHPQSRVRLGPRLSGVFDQIRAWRGKGDAEVPALPSWVLSAG